MCFTIRTQITTDILCLVFTWHRMSYASSIATSPVITRKKFICENNGSLEYLDESSNTAVVTFFHTVKNNSKRISSFHTFIFCNCQAWPN
jgi:hypothetical protein